MAPSRQLTEDATSRAMSTTAPALDVSIPSAPEIIDLEDDNLVSQLQTAAARHKLEKEAQHLAARQARGPFGNGTFVDAGGGVFSVDPRSGCIDIHDDDGHLTTNTLVLSNKPNATTLSERQISQNEQHPADELAQRTAELDALPEWVRFSEIPSDDFEQMASAGVHQLPQIEPISQLFSSRAFSLTPAHMVGVTPSFRQDGVAHHIRSNSVHPNPNVIHPSEYSLPTPLPQLRPGAAAGRTHVFHAGVPDFVIPFNNPPPSHFADRNLCTPVGSQNELAPLAEPSANRAQSFEANCRTGAATPISSQTDVPECIEVAPRRSCQSDYRSNEYFSKEKLQDLVKKNGLTADATEEAPTPDELKVSLMPHQRRALAWMAKRELYVEDEDEIVNLDEQCRGGILADDQGLGKTLSVISVILKNSRVSLKKGDHSSKIDALGKRDSSSSWRTLIVCPVSLVGQWKEELESKIKPEYTPSIYIYHGPKRARGISELQNYDIVLTTYSTLALEYPKVLKSDPMYEARKLAKLPLPRRQTTALYKCEWRRVVLDEAHYIKNRRTDAWAAAAALSAECRWCLTGTPIQNSVDDIYSLFLFIRYNFVPNYEIWNSQWKRRLEHSQARIRERAFKLFQTIVGVVLLRRTKEDTIDGKPLIVLPKRICNVWENEFDDKDEAAVYKCVQEKSILEVNKFLVAGTLTHNYSSVLLLLLRLRQACCHPFLIEYAQLHGKNAASASEELLNFQSPYSTEALDEAMELIAAGHSLLDLFDDDIRERVMKALHPVPKGACESDFFSCGQCQCRSPWANGTVLPCGHFFCTSCSSHATLSQSCFQCSKFFQPDSDGVMPLDDLRKEVHATVRENIVAAVTLPKQTKKSLKALLQAEVLRRRNANASSEALEMRPTKRHRLNKSTMDANGSSNLQTESDMSTDSVPLDGKSSSNASHESSACARESNACGKLEPRCTQEIAGAKVEEKLFRNKEEPLLLRHENVRHSQDEIVEKDHVSVLKSRNFMCPKKEAGVSNNEEVWKRKISDLEQKSVPGQDETQNPNQNLSQDERLFMAISQKSTKLKLLLQKLRDIRNRGKDEKILLFSQWTTMLDIIEFHIQIEGYETCRLDGSMPMAERKRQIHEFKANKSKVVFLISLHAGGTGLNLTEATYVIMFDVWWNPQTEEQAIDRVHRIGQSHDVHVFRFKMLNTVEERIYQICARKRELSDGALGVTGAQSLGRQKLSLEEIMFLFSGAAEDVAQHSNANSEAARAANNILNYRAFR